MKSLNTIRMTLVGLFLCSTLFSWAQTPMYSLGTPSGGGNTIPFYYLGAGCRAQHMWPAGAFGTVPKDHNITTIYFASTTTGTQLYSNFNVSIKQAAITSLTSAYETGMTSVLTATGYTINRVANQYFAINLTTPFKYDPALPIIVEINQLSSGGGSHSSVVHTTIPGSWRNWSTGYNASAPSGNGAYTLYFGFDIVPALTGPNDAGVEKFISPKGDCEGSYDVDVLVKNNGINQINPVTVNWSVNGLLQTPVTYTKKIDTLNGFGSSTAVVRLGSVNLVNGNIDELKAWTTNPNNVNDTVAKNDTATLKTSNLPVVNTFPYYQDFENGQADWTIGGTNSTWAFGNPAKLNISGAASGTNAFVTGGLGTGTYAVNENSDVSSPCFDLSNFVGTPWVALDASWYSQTGFDGAVLQYTTDGGETWENVGDYNDPNNWYNDNSLDFRPGGSMQGWAGTAAASSGWVRAKHVLDQGLVGGNVRFRVAFGSDASTHYDGFAFDNFTLVDYQMVDLGPKRSLCGKPNVTLNPNIQINGILKWFNGDSTSTTIQVTSTGKFWATYTDTFINESSSDTIQIVQSVAPAIQFSSYMDTITKDGLTTLNPNLPFDLNYQWSPANVSYPFYVVLGKDHSPGPHTFSLLVIDSLFCTDQKSATVVIINEVGLAEHETGLIHCYPNPVKDELIIESTGLNGQSTLSLFDVNGREVYVSQLALSEVQMNRIDVSNLQSGTYILRLINENQVIISKIMKE